MRTFKESVLASARNLSTSRQFYFELSKNPFSETSRLVFLEKYPEVDVSDIPYAIILAEPGGMFDLEFSLLDEVSKSESLQKQEEVTKQVNLRLLLCCKENIKELKLLSEDIIFNRLCQVVFGHSGRTENEELYSQNQRRDFKLTIADFIVNLKNQKPSFYKGINKPKAVLKISFMSALVISAFLLYRIQSFRNSGSLNTKDEVLASQVEVKNIGFPVRIRIPKLDVDAAIVYVDLTSDGAMGVPGDPLDVGWYDLGAIPGETGSAVMDGHLDTRTGKSGVFNELDKLVPGDKIEVESSKNIVTTFVVRESKTYIPGFADEVFFSTDGKSHLNLITCDGLWDEEKKSYSKRLVVFTDILE